MKIDFRTNAHKLFTKVYYTIAKAKTRFVVVYGGSGSSKSFSAHQHELINLMMRSDGDTLILRKHGSDLKDSCYKLLQDLITEYNLTSLFKFTFSNDNRRITYTPTGLSFKFRGVDDSEKLKSIVGIKRILMEEASQFEFSDLLEINRRARGIKDIQITLILNPISENHWIKKNMCDVDGPYTDRTTVIRANYQLNPFLTDDDILELENIKKVNENQYRIYVLGEWGIEDKTKKFAYAFDVNKHVSKVTLNPEHLVWLSFDFNVNPISCTAFQHYDNKLFAIKSFRHDNSNIYVLCKTIKAFLPNALIKVTGDATGQNRTAMTHEATNYYTIIKDELQLTWQQFKVPTVNPPIEENQLLVNAVLYNYDVAIDPDECKDLIYDLNYVEVDERKKIIKDRTNDKRNADFLDHFRYLCNILFPDMKQLIKKN